MKPMEIRKLARQYASHLKPERRREWMEKRLASVPKVGISSGWVPNSVSRSFLRDTVGGIK